MLCKRCCVCEKQWDREECNRLCQVALSLRDLLHIIVVSPNDSLPGTGPLSIFSRQLEGSSMFFPESLGFDCFQLKITHMPKRRLGVTHFVLLYHLAF